MVSAAVHIQNFEDFRLPNGRFVFHVEHLAERSAPHNWIIPPHRHIGYTQIFLLRTGGLELAIDGQTTMAGQAPLLASIPPGTSHALRLQPGSDGLVTTFRAPPGAGVDPNLAPRLMETIFFRPRAVELADGDVEAEHLAQLLYQMKAEHDAPADDPTRGALLFAAALLTVRSIFLARPDNGKADQRSNRRFTAFGALMEQHLTEHWPLARYAEALNISESTLERICRTSTGLSPFRILRDRLIQESKRRLAYTTLPISRIADELGFADAAYFSRFFRNATGLAPRAFRLLAK